MLDTQQQPGLFYLEDNVTNNTYTMGCESQDRDGNEKNVCTHEKIDQQNRIEFRIRPIDLQKFNLLWR